MRSRILCLLLLVLLLALPSVAETRVLLIACREFQTLPNLGTSVSGNLQLLQDTFLQAGVAPEHIRIEDGTIAGSEPLRQAITDSFGESDEDDLSIRYLCTHGIDRSGDRPAHLVLSDGNEEHSLEADALFRLLSPLRGDVLVLIDSCHSGALIGRGIHEPTPYPLPPHLHVLTSSLGSESAWYYGHHRLSDGAVSYFADALCAGLGLYGALSADANGDEQVTLSELSTYIRRTVASSTCQVASRNAGQLLLPTCPESDRSRPVFGFTCGSQLISTSNTDFTFSFNVRREARIEYRLIPYQEGHWNWASPIVIPDSESGLTGLGGKTRTLSISPENRSENGYLIFQIFAYEQDRSPQLCAERLLAIQADNTSPDLTLQVTDASLSSAYGLPVLLSVSLPSIFRVSVYSRDGMEIRRLYYGELTRPSQDNIQVLTWDLHDEDGHPVSPGIYTIEIMAVLSGQRVTTSADVTVSPSVSISLSYDL
ncbi:MAG: hypothetical protein IJ088_04020 [Clostridia bacterium]|nr:hypothetical protein [Clostridia bacterium]